MRGHAPALPKACFLSIVRAELGTEVLAAGRSPKFNITVAGAEWLVAERAASGAAVHKIFAARDHQIAPPSEKQDTVLAS
jgi:hypothetical protein